MGLRDVLSEATKPIRSAYEPLKNLNRSDLANALALATGGQRSVSRRNYVKNMTPEAMRKLYQDRNRGEVLRLAQQGIAGVGDLMTQEPDNS